MTPERLDRIEAHADAFKSSEDYHNTKMLCAALRQAWAERDMLVDEVERLQEIKSTANSLLGLAWYRYGLKQSVLKYDSNPEEFKQLLTDLGENTPVPIAAILAARKEQRDE